MISAKIDAKFNDQLIRLKRNHKNLLRLNAKMNSYRYEPKDYACFIRLRDLRQRLNEMVTTQANLIERLSQKNTNSKEATAQVVSAIKDYQQLDGEVAAYLLDNQGFQ